MQRYFLFPFNIVKKSLEKWEREIEKGDVDVSIYDQPFCFLKNGLQLGWIIMKINFFLKLLEIDQFYNSHDIDGWARKV